jgi:UDP-3-O-[3-hydroxymyristoyl] glucosamine N-acyltransferase
MTTLLHIATIVNARIDELSEAVLAQEVTGVGTLEAATQGQITFLANPKYARFIPTTQASYILVPRDFQPSAPLSATLLRVDNPQAAFLLVVKHFAPEPVLQRGFRHSSAVIHESARVHPSVYVGPHVSIEAGCELAEDVVIHAGVVLYPNTSVGAGSTLHANVVCYHDTHIGERCIIHAGAVIGADGFGFAEQADGSFEKIPQIGNVVIQDDVEIGANCTIDRAALGSTTIEHGVKLDNLIHVAHNAVIGEHTAIAAQAGVSGSTRLGKRNRVAGQVGFVGHISTADDVVVFAQSGVSKAITHKGIYFGYPAQAHTDELKQQAALRQLPALLAEVRRLQQEIERLKSL